MTQENTITHQAEKLATLFHGSNVANYWPSLVC